MTPSTTITDLEKMRNGIADQLEWAAPYATVAVEDLLRSQLKALDEALTLLRETKDEKDHGAELAAAPTIPDVASDLRQESKVIGGKHPRDGRNWDNQCARCGSSVAWNECDNCGGEGWIEDEDWQADEGDGHDCDWCSTEGGHWSCISSVEYCEGNPITDRGDIKRGTVEWFTFDAPLAATPPSALLRETPQPSNGRSLKDYRPTHDEDCESRKCAKCAHPWPHRGRGRTCEIAVAECRTTGEQDLCGCVFQARPCSCGLNDLLRETTPQETTQERKKELLGGVSPTEVDAHPCSVPTDSASHDGE